MNEFAELKQQIESLQARVEELESDGPEVIQDTAKTFVDPFGIERKTNGERIISGQTESYEDRQRQRVKRMDAEIKESERKSTEGLPDGLYRDPFNIVRRKGTGETVDLETYMAGHTPDALYQRGKILPGDPIPGAE